MVFIVNLKAFPSEASRFLLFLSFFRFLREREVYHYGHLIMRL